MAMVTSDPNPKHRDHFVADDADYARDANGEQLPDRLWVDQAINRLIGGDKSAEQDNQENCYFPPDPQRGQGHN
jgi:hypothetical protein